MAKKRKAALVQYGAISYPGGRKLEITSEHEEWLDWAIKALYEQAERDREQAEENAFVSQGYLGQ